MREVQVVNATSEPVGSESIADLAQAVLEAKLFASSPPMDPDSNPEPQHHHRRYQQFISM